MGRRRNDFKHIEFDVFKIRFIHCQLLIRVNSLQKMDKISVIKRDITKIAVETVVNFLEINDSIDSVIFVCFDDENYELYEMALNNL